MPSDTVIQTFLNTTFSSLDDLRNVEKVISQIEQTRSTLREERTEETNGVAEDDKTVRSETDQLMEQLSKIVDSDDLMALDKLRSKYGELEVIEVVRDGIMERTELKRIQKLDDLYAELNDKLSDFELFDLADGSGKGDVEKLSKLKELHDEVENFALQKKSNYDHEVGASLQGEWVTFKDELDEYTGSLNGRLSSIIAENFKEKLESTLKNDVEGFDKKKFSAEETRKLNGDFQAVLELQLLDPINSNPGYPSTWWAMDCLCHSFQVRFVYHFEGNNETNRLDKPEFALEYILGFIQKTLPAVKLLFGNTFHRCSSAGTFDNCFITSVLSVAREKFKSDRNLCLPNEKLLSHLILELQKFDQRLKQDFSYRPIKGKEWPGITYDLILSYSVVFDRWLNNEKEFVNHRYDEIINEKDAFVIDYGFVESGHTQPTKSAINMSNLLDGITANYANLPLEYQLKFLSDVQLKLLNFYFAVLKQGTKALDSLGKNDEISFIERLCRIWCSADYMIELMKNWGERLFFVELWNSINPDNECQNTFFDSVIGGYEKGILDQMPKRLKQYEERQLNRTMKEYFQSDMSWSNATSVNRDPSELELPIQALKGDLLYLQKTLSRFNFLEVKLYFSEVISTYFEKNFVRSNRFNEVGASQLRNHLDKFYESLGLIKDFKYYARLSEMIDLLEGRTVGEGSGRLSREEISNLMRRKVGGKLSKLAT
ncbi:DEKNAAC102615 [Brettanomyces naardenensis]|uniref:DEKNAAC102615 n=1 Tax=Brettanomyces naardenensis TaxID=13370 RepID=A0A448YLF9_BRENA|nr:DEKNAAC102615 [Brettanomyces naardenensis]